MLFDLSDRKVLITGGSRGIGLGIASVFARAGAAVAILARNGETLATAAGRLAGLGASAVVTVVGDVTDRADGQAAICRGIAELGGLDVLCANAGAFPDAKLADLSEQQVDDLFALNIKGTIWAVQAAIPALEASTRGRVVITSSITGPVTGYPGWSHYGATKAAQLGFMRSAALELAPKGITVNAVMPGSVLTDALAALGDGAIASMRAVIPLHRIGDPEDIGAAAAFLATTEAGYITGQTLIVDGGQTLPEIPEAVL